MVKKLFAVAAMTLLLGACGFRERPPLAEGPVGPPPGAKFFTVQFDSGSSTLDKMAMGTLDKAAESFKAGGVSRVTVTGYADTVGNVKSNQELSERRAYAVRGALYTRGVPVDAMTVIANGEDKLVVKTADETAEARNRVVTIRLK